MVFSCVPGKCILTVYVRSIICNMFLFALTLYGIGLCGGNLSLMISNFLEGSGSILPPLSSQITFWLTSPSPLSSKVTFLLTPPTSLALKIPFCQPAPPPSPPLHHVTNGKPLSPKHNLQKFTLIHVIILYHFL